MSLEGRTAILFGAGVLAAGYAPKFVEEGVKILLVGKDDTADKLARQLPTRGGVKVVTMDLDLADPAKVAEAYQKAKDEFDSIDIVVNGAGGNKREATVANANEFYDRDPAAQKKVMDINFWSKVWSIEEFARYLKETGFSGRVVNIASMSGLQPLSKVGAYSASFGALQTYTPFAAHFYGAQDLGEINNVAVGFTLSEQNRHLLLNDDGTLKDRAVSILEDTASGEFVKPAQVARHVLNYADPELTPAANGSTVRVDNAYAAVGLARASGYSKPVDRKQKH